MKTKSFGFTLLTAISAIALSAVAFGRNATATDTSSPSLSPVVSTDSGVNDEVEILSLVSNQSDVTENAQAADSTNDENETEDAIEQAAFDDDVKAAVLAGDSISSAQHQQRTASAAIVTSIDSPEVAAIAADDSEAHTLILGLPQK